MRTPHGSLKLQSVRDPYPIYTHQIGAFDVPAGLARDVHLRVGVASCNSAGDVMHQANELKGLRKVTGNGAASWMSLAATTVGLDDFGRLRVGVTARVELAGALRLVVQAYAADAEFAGGLPVRGERPIAAAQRAVSQEELRRGVAVSVVLSSGRRSWADGVNVVAWLEPGAPDLEFDGLCARPAGAVYVGSCGVSSDRADLVLQRTAA